ncbi:hypothetical protein DL96DRAFT_117871 [Flagelloscypha sp. PMI_526]|nr:hypothetical protein DL96DRAFT_117871 [Flagelloscypha sp. PMI_526]
MQGKRAMIFMASTFIDPSSIPEETRVALQHAVNSVVAPYELGILISMLLFGGVTFAARSYFSEFDDRVSTKILVGFTWCIMLAHIIFGIIAVHDMTVVHYGDYTTLIYYPKFIYVNLALSGILSTTTQSFFAFRLWKLSRSIVVPFFCWVLSTTRLSTILSLSIQSMIVPPAERTVERFKQKHHWLIVSTMILSVSVDVIITTSLISQLRSRRCSELLARTRRVLDRLILWTLQTGLLTSASTITMAVTYLTLDNFAWLALLYTSASLFAVSLLASLNARTKTRNALQKSVDGSLLFPSDCSEGGVSRRVTVTGRTMQGTLPDLEKAPESTSSMESEMKEQ